MPYSRSQYVELLKPMSIDNKLIRLPSMIAYQEEQVVLAQETFDIAERYFDLERARIETEEYAIAKVEGYTLPLAKAKVDLRILSAMSHVISYKTALNIEKLSMKLLENEFTATRKLANLKEAEINKGI